jgi:signal transduction histidine kinase
MVLLMCSAGLFAQLIALLFIPTMGPGASLPSWVGLVAMVALYGLARRRSLLAAWLFTIGLMAVLTTLLFYGGGLAMGYGSLLAVVAVQGALVLGPRAGGALTVWAVGTAVASYVFGSSSVLLMEGHAPESVLLAIQLVSLLVLGSLVTFSVARLRRATARATADRERLHRAQLESGHFIMAMGEPVWVTEEDLTVVLANPAAMELIGGGSLLGQALETWLVMPSVHDRRARGEGVLKSVRGPMPVQVSRSMVAHGSGHRWIIVASDMSRRVEAEERIREAATAADDANRAKSHFLANISHELRTPLNAILGYSEMLLESSRSEEEQRDIERIHSSGAHLLGLINDILDMSKIEAGEMDVTEEVHALDRIVASCVATLMPLAEAQGNQLVVEGPAVVIWSDGRKLSQILLNLLSNAVKFTHNGTVRIRTEVGSQLRIEVIDTGRGISVEDMRSLFQPFRQRGADAVLQPGTGLGLVLCQRLAALLGGSVDAKSVEGVGSTFALVLPLSCIQTIVNPAASAPPTTS